MGTTTTKQQPVTKCQLMVKRDLLTEMFMWRDGHANHPFSSQIYDFWHSSRCPKVLAPIQDALFGGLDSYSVEDISKFTHESASQRNYIIAYQRATQVCVACFENALLSHQLQISTLNADSQDNVEDDNNNDVNNTDKVLLTDAEILRISFACLYYCQAVSIEHFIPQDMSVSGLKECFSKQIISLNKSLVQYDLAKVKVRICQGWLISYIKKSKEELESSITELLDGIERNEQFYTAEAHRVCIEEEITSITNSLKLNTFNIDSGGCIIL